jgi:hypothetical protein
MYAGETLMGNIDQEIQGFIVPPKGVAKSPPMKLKCRLSLSAAGALWAAFRKNLYITVNSTMQMKVGEFSTPLIYSQRNVSTTLGNP